MRPEVIRGSIIILIWGMFMTGCGSRKEEFLIQAAGSDFYTEEKREAEGSVPPQKEQLQEPGSTEENGLQQSAKKQTDTQTGAVCETLPPAVIYVDVCGAVKQPGVYQLPEGSRVFEAVRLAGGFSDEAAPASVNQALPLSDGQQLIVLTEEETKRQSPETASASGQEPEASDSYRININTADKQELMTLSGIGETRAEAILSYREKHGKFSSAEDLLQVSGIKEGTLAKIRDRIVTG